MSRSAREARQKPAPEPEKSMATDYWLELVAYPEGSARSLWLKVDGKWCHHHNPDEGIQNAIVQAFSMPEKHQVQVWYHNDTVVGLVVCNKTS